MKKILAMAAVAVLGLTLATPALADHDGYYRGRRAVRGGYGYRASYYAPRPRYHTSISFGLGLPFFAYGAYYAPPAPYYYAPAYYGPAPVVVGPGYCQPYWVPGHYAYRGGGEIWLAGYWAR